MLLILFHFRHCHIAFIFAIIAIISTLLIISISAPFSFRFAYSCHWYYWHYISWYFDATTISYYMILAIIDIISQPLITRLLETLLTFHYWGWYFKDTITTICQDSRGHLLAAWDIRHRHFHFSASLFSPEPGWPQSDIDDADCHRWWYYYARLAADD